MIDKKGCTIWRARVVSEVRVVERMFSTRENAENWLNWELTCNEEIQTSVRECRVEYDGDKWAVDIL